MDRPQIATLAAVIPSQADLCRTRYGRDGSAIRERPAARNPTEPTLLCSCSQYSIMPSTPPLSSRTFPKHDTPRQNHACAAVPVASPGLAPACAVDGVRLQRGPRVFLPMLPSQLVVIASHHGGREPLPRTRLPAVHSPGHGRGRVRRLRSIQPLPHWRLRSHEGGHPALRRKPVRPALCRQNPHPAVLRRRGSPHVSVALPPRVQPVGRTHCDAARILVIPLAVLQRHDGQRSDARPLRSDVDLPRHGGLRTGRPLPSAVGQDVHRAVAWLACVGPGAAVRHLRFGARPPAGAFCRRNFYPPPPVIMSS